MLRQNVRRSDCITVKWSGSQAVTFEIIDDMWAFTPGMNFLFENQEFKVDFLEMNERLTVDGKLVRWTVIGHKESR